MEGWRGWRRDGGRGRDGGMEGWRDGGRGEGWREGGVMEGGGRDAGRGEGWRDGGRIEEGGKDRGRMEEGGKDRGRGEVEREEGVRQGATSSRQFWALVAVRGGGCCACRLHRSRRPSSPFVIVAGGPRSSLASSGGHCLRLRMPSSFVGGWGGRSSSPVGFPGLWAVVL